ncbi:DUF4906 domain-containing protein [Bacteroides sp.]|uniref:DUF4906 domain-containing protein n=1 Tax=Bacteroides sp. TaxID=29523 RepID=UPI002624BA26|nr:DUF4906 domain-containing protein [Bacteroides sp.]MDD3038949.1 DUF4906 domain-containing protein [Bacteroides sp.]
MKAYKYIFLLSCLWLAACTQNNEWIGENIDAETSSEGIVHLNLQSAEISVDTRSITPQDPMTDNPIYDLCLLHYNFEGQLIAKDTKYQVFGTDAPQLGYQWSPTLTIDPQNRTETLCLVANMDGNHPTWPSRLADLKEMTVDLQFNSSNGLISNKKMYMFGYYEGAIQSNKSINIMLGRMTAAVKFVISAKDASSSINYQIKSIEIVKAAVKSYFFPHNSTNNIFGSTFKESFNPSDFQIANASTEFSYYYQIGENISPSSTNHTQVVITANRGSKSTWTTKRYTVDLGCDRPEVPNRNYSLYRNNNYTFNIVLNN